MRALSTEGIVVRIVDFGEADRVATMLTPEVGKVSGVARGARRSRKRYGGLSAFALGEAQLRERRGELWVLEEFHVAQGFPHLGLDVARLAQAAYVCELARELCPLHQPEPRLYHLVRETLVRLDTEALPPARLRTFELALLDAVGLQPSLDRCVQCGQDPRARPGPLGLDARRGGVLCAPCAADDHAPGLRPLSPAALDALLWALLSARRAGQDPAAAASDDAAAAAPVADPAAWAAARDAMQSILATHLGRPLQSVEFITKMNAAGPTRSAP